MADVKTDLSYEAAHEANSETGATEKGRTMLADPELGKTILNKYEEAENLKAENVRDPLTGAFNRRYFDQQLEDRLQNGKKLSLVMVDIDHFKEFNDAYGHKTGDRLLIEMVRTLSNHLRLSRPNGSKDFLARYGGEEFAIVLADVSDLEIAQKIADNLRSQIAESKFKIDKDTIAVKTVSMGVAVAREIENPDELVARADRAMYVAKDKGRNRVETAPI
jgi:diguanylate cyclase (GGDEF)-like protein